MNTNEKISAFLSYIENVERLSENTCKNYKVDLSHFEKFLTEKEIEVENVTVQTINAFVATQTVSKATTINRRLSSITSFYAYLILIGDVAINPVLAVKKRPKITVTVPDIMTESEQQKVLSVVANHNYTKGDTTFFRNYAILNLLFASGIRRDELANLKVADVMLSENAVIVSKGKGDKQRLAYYNDKTRAILCEYIQAYRPLYTHSNTSEYLFLGATSERLHDNTIHRIVCYYFELAGCKKAGRAVHATRKRFTQNAYQISHDVYAVANLLGHTNINNVQRYAVAEQERNKAICMGF